MYDNVRMVCKLFILSSSLLSVTGRMHRNDGIKTKIYHPRTSCTRQIVENIERLKRASAADTVQKYLLFSSDAAKHIYYYLLNEMSMNMRGNKTEIPNWYLALKSKRCNNNVQHSLLLLWNNLKYETNYIFHKYKYFMHGHMDRVAKGLFLYLKAKTGCQQRKIEIP